MLNVILRRTAQPDTAALLRQLAGMIPAGLPVTRCFDILEQTEHHANIRAGLFKIKNHLLAGHSLSESMHCQPDWFDAFTCSLIHLGEQTGKLDVVLLTLAADHENKQEFRRTLHRALFYPCIILSVAIIMTCCMLIFVIPAFAALFHGMDKPLPLLTRMIFAISSLCTHALPVIAILIVITIFTLTARKKMISALLQRLTSLPPFAGMLQTLALIRLLRNLALALSAGMPILDALQLSTTSSGHEAINSSARQLRSALCAGHTLYQAMQTLPVFPILARQMVRVGEESGALDKMLSKSAEILEMQLNSSIFRLTQLLEPLIMSVLGVLIGSLVIGMYLPVFNLGSAL